MKFEIRDDASVQSHTVTGVVAGAASSWTVPAGTFGGGSTYEARVGVISGEQSTWTGWRSFTLAVDATQGPDQPSLEAGDVDDSEGLIDPSETPLEITTEDEQAASGTYTDDDLIALDAAIDVEYAKAVENGVIEPDADVTQSAARPVWEKYAPKMFLHPGEQYWPLSSWTSLKHSDLLWSHQGCRDYKASTEPGATRLADGYYTHRVFFGFCFDHGGTFWHSDQYVGPKKDGGPWGNDGFYLNINDRYHDGDGFQEDEPIYWYFQYGEYLQYFMHYGYSKLDDLPQGHEEDWESIAIRLDDNNVPQEIEYFRHHSSCTLPWGSAPKVDHRHPKVAVAKESHGNYPLGARPLIYDDISGDGPKWYANRNLQAVVAQDWYGYGGIWGDNGNYENFSGPLGPGAARRYDSSNDPPRFASARCHTE